MTHKENNAASAATAAAVEMPLPPHVLIFPLLMQGHVNSMLKLAELCCIFGFHVTVLLSDYTQGHLLRHANVKSRFSKYLGFQFATISNGLPDDHSRASERSIEIMMSLKMVGESQFKNLMVSTHRLTKNADDGVKMRPVTCLILDRVLSFAAVVSEEMGIPYIYFRTVGSCSFWANFSIEDVIDTSEAPVRGKDEDKVSYRNKKEMDSIVTSVAGMEGFLRRCDLPAFFWVTDVNDPEFQTIKTETRRSTKGRALILNTFEDLEGPILNQIRKHIPTLFLIGLLHTHLNARITSNKFTAEQLMSHSGSFWEKDRSCVDWLNSQPHKSVIYVSFGSVTIMTRNELLEYWYGLVNSGQRFLWVRRPDFVIGKDRVSKIPFELEEGTKTRGYIVGWAPQEDVLAHLATGAFLTHSGWNSTLEGIFAEC